MVSKLTDNFLARARKFVPEFLQDSFASAINSKLYKFSNLYSQIEMRSNVQQSELLPYVSSPHKYGTLDIQTEVDFFKSIEMARRLTPSYLKTLMTQHGVTLKVGKIMSDINPLYRTLRARGQDCVVNNVMGGYQVMDRAVCVAQGYISTKTDEYIPSDHLHITYTTLHEFGHAIEMIIFPEDRGLGNLDKTQQHYIDFVKAYHKDVEVLNGRTKGVREIPLDYYLSKENGGTHENDEDAISELFADLLAERCCCCFPRLYLSFLNTAKVYDKISDSLKYAVENAPHRVNTELICYPSMP